MRVAIAEDSGFFRDALAEALESVGVDVTSKVDNIPDLLRDISISPPDVVLLDICLPPTKTDEGLVAAETLGQTNPEIGVLVLSAHLGMAHVSRLLANGRTGVGCLSKDQLHDSGMLLDALQRIRKGGTYIDPDFVTARLRSESLQAALTQREMQILQSVAQGLSNQGIANQLFINVKTVESAITSVFRKLQLEGGQTNARVCAALTFLSGSLPPGAAVFPVSKDS